jgi:hypothetical protein
MWKGIPMRGTQWYILGRLCISKISNLVRIVAAPSSATKFFSDISMNWTMVRTDVFSRVRPWVAPWVLI